MKKKILDFNKQESQNLKIIENQINSDLDLIKKNNQNLETAYLLKTKTENAKIKTGTTGRLITKSYWINCRNWSFIWNWNMDWRSIWIWHWK